MIESQQTVVIKEPIGLNRQGEPLTFGMPFPQGELRGISKLALIDGQETKLPMQAKVLSHWPDGSICWLLVDTQVSLRPYEEKSIGFHVLNNGCYSNANLQISEFPEYCQVTTGRAVFNIDKSTFTPFASIQLNEEDYLDRKRSRFVVRDDRGREYLPSIEQMEWEARGPLRATLKLVGTVIPKRLRFVARLTLYSNHCFVKIDFTLHNPRRARHQGGLWDLGDPGSVYFQEASLRLAMASDCQAQGLYRTESELNAVESSSSLQIYQDSSGGENWSSQNHVNCRGHVPLSFQGYQIRQDENIIGQGKRAQPVIALVEGKKYLAITTPQFWQNFPKSIEVDDNVLTLGLFPRQFRDSFELQGGEQKTHTVLCDFGRSEVPLQSLTACLTPIQISYNSDWCRQCGLVSIVPDELDDRGWTIFDMMQTAISGDRSFFARREIIDEYGWRNFGDLFADHETVFHQGDEFLVSHYNNQYDVIYGALQQFLITGQHEWFRLAHELAAHVIDIDIYHTNDDRLEYNHGMFWHTNHHLGAGRCTHRGFSADHLEKVVGSYGGGPSLSHVYSTGLLYHYYMTGNRASLEAFLELTTFVTNNINANKRVTKKIKQATKNVVHKIRNLAGEKLVDYNKIYELDGPGRASGNVVSVLCDAFVLLSERTYLSLAEQIIRECINPQDDLEKRDLRDVENRWMYTVFLQSLGKYLQLKNILQQRDEMYEYTLQSLLHYARWMVDSEYIYLQQPQKLEFPNETWAAQELRKSSALIHAAQYASAMYQSECQAFEKKATFFWQEGIRLLESFEARFLTRPLALLMQNSIVLMARMNRTAQSEVAKLAVDLNNYKAPSIPAVPKEASSQ